MKLLLLSLALVVLAAASSPFSLHYVEREEQGLITIDADSIVLEKLLNELASLQQKNIIFLGEVNKKIQMHIHKVSFEKAFNIALTAGSLCENHATGVTYVGTCRQIKAMDKRKRDSVDNIYSFSLNNISIGDFLPILLKKYPVDVISEEYITNTFKVNCSSSRATEIRSLIQQADLLPQQIRIRAYIVSIDHDYLAELGMKLGLNSKDSNPSLIKVFSGKFGTLDAELRALEQHGQGRVISAPELITLNKKIASIETGDEIPYYESDNNGASTVVFKKAVLSLKFLPEVIGKNNIKLHITINQDQPGQSYGGTLAIKTRKIDTDAIVSSGDSLVLGGIFEQHKSNAESKIPILGDFPIIGSFFSLDEEIVKKRQMIIFILPQLIM